MSQLQNPTDPLVALLILLALAVGYLGLIVRVTQAFASQIARRRLPRPGLAACAYVLCVVVVASVFIAAQWMLGVSLPGFGGLAQFLDARLSARRRLPRA